MLLLFSLACLCASLPLHDACVPALSACACDALRRAMTAAVLALSVHGLATSSRPDLVLAHGVLVVLAAVMLAASPRLVKA